MDVQTRSFDLYQRQLNGTNSTTDVATITFPATLIQTVAYIGGFTGTSTLTRSLVVGGKDEFDSLIVQGWTIPGTATATPTSISNQAEPHGLKRIFVVIIAVLVVAFLFGAGVAIWIIRRHRRRRHFVHVSVDRSDLTEAKGRNADGSGHKAELPGSLLVASMDKHGTKKAELWTDANRHELEGITVWPKSPKIDPGTQP